MRSRKTNHIFKFSIFQRHADHFSSFKGCREVIFVMTNSTFLSIFRLKKLRSQERRKTCSTKTRLDVNDKFIKQLMENMKRYNVRSSISIKSLHHLLLLDYRISTLMYYATHEISQKFS